MTYTDKDYEKLLFTLTELSDKKFRDFNLRLIPGESSAYGVRVPQLRTLAKEIAGQDADGFFKMAKDNTFEETMLQAMVIGAVKCDVKQRLIYVENFVPKISNWAVCDIFCGDLKAVKKDLPAVRAFLTPYLQSAKEFTVRFAVVMLMQYYVGDTYIHDTIKALTAINHEGYYVKMAVAWALSVCFVKQRDVTLPIIRHGLSDDFTHNKTIQKCCESLRVSKEDKSLLRSLKRK